MINARAYKNYFGGKSGNGTYQNIINHIPPHDIFMSLFLGNCGITRKIKPAKRSILNDLDPEVMQEWEKLELPLNYELLNVPALKILQHLPHFLGVEGLMQKIFIYLDPPYRKEVRKVKTDVYRFEMTDNDHADLLSQIVAVTDQYKNIPIMVSHYPDPFYDKRLPGWFTFDYYSMIRNGLVLERIYCNFPFTDSLHDYSYIGSDFREREALSRIKKNFLKKLNEMPAQLRNAIIQDLLAK